MDKFRRFVAKTLTILGIIMMIVGVLSLFISWGGWFATASGAINVSWLGFLSNFTWASFGWWMIALGALAVVTGYLIDPRAAGEIIDRVAESTSKAAKGLGKVVWSALEGVASSVPGWAWLAAGVALILVVGSAADNGGGATRVEVSSGTASGYEPGSPEDEAYRRGVEPGGYA